MIKLTPLAITDFSVKYAHNLGNGTIRHYSVRLPHLLTTAQSADEVVLDYFNNENLGPVFIERLPKIDNPDKAVKGTSLSARSAPEVLKGLWKVKRQLNRMKVKSQVFQYTVLPPGWKYYFNYAAGTINNFTGRLNHFFKRNLFPYISVSGNNRRMECCKYLTVSFEESYRAQATELLRKDLKKLSDLGLILGHLCMPSEIELADTIGSGQKSFTLFCFLFTDSQKFGKLIGLENPFDRSKICLDAGKGYLELNHFLDIKTDTAEGCASHWDSCFSSKYKIEEIDIFAASIGAAHQEYLISYEESRKIIDKNHKILNERRSKEVSKVPLQEQANPEIDLDAKTLISDKDE